MRALPSAKKTYTVYECSQILGIQPISVRRAIQRGWLPAHKHKNQWLVTQTDLHNYEKKL